MSEQKKKSRARDLERFSEGQVIENGTGEERRPAVRRRRVSTRETGREAMPETDLRLEELAENTKPRRKGSVRLVSAVIAVLIAVAITAMITYSSAYKKVEKEFKYSRQPVIVEENEALEAIRTGLENGDSVTASLRKGFKNYMVVHSGSRYSFIPVNFSLKMHDRIGKNVSKVSNQEWEYRVNGKTVSYKGIDVSSHQGDIEWDKVAADKVRFTMIRAVYRGYESGKLKTDDNFAINAKGASENGIAIGAYLFSQAVNEQELDEEVDLLLKTIAPYKIKCPVAMDIELANDGAGRADTLSVEERTALAKRFCERVEAAGYTPMLYFNFETAMKLIDLEQLEDVQKWFATYTMDFYYPYYYSVWQYSSTGRVNGIQGDVDMDMSFEKFW